MESLDRNVGAFFLTNIIIRLKRLKINSNFIFHLKLNFILLFRGNQFVISRQMHNFAYEI